MKPQVTVKNLTTFDDGSEINRTEKMDRWQLAQHLKAIRNSLDLVMIRDGKGYVYITPVTGGFDRSLGWL